MTKTIRARYRRGMIEPLEKLDIEEGQELTVTISDTLIEEKVKTLLIQLLADGQNLLTLKS